MTKEASLEVGVTLTVRAIVAAEFATHTELRTFIERHTDEVRVGVSKAVRSGVREVGWLDDNRPVYVTEIVEAEPVDPQPFRDAVWNVDRSGFRPGDALDAFDRTMTGVKVNR